MRKAGALFFINALAWISMVRAHEPGQEFTYLSLFQRPSSPQGYSAQERATLASQYIRRHSLTGETRRHRLRKLQSENQDDDGMELLETRDDENGQQDESFNNDEAPAGDEPVRVGDESQESEKTEVEEFLGDTNNEEIEASNGDPDDESRRHSVRESTEIPRKVVHVADDDATEESDEEGNARKRRRTSTKSKSSGDKSREKDVAKRKPPPGKDKNADSESDMRPEAIIREGRKNGEDLKRLPMMLMKIVKQYKVAKSKLNNNFTYYCIDTNREILNVIKTRVTSEMNAKFMIKRFWKESLPTADLVFSWAGLDNMKEENVVKYLERLSVSKHKMILLGSHSGDLESEGADDKVSRFTLGGRPINLRREPFNLAKPMRIVGDLSAGGNDKQLYIYKPKEMVAAE